MRVYNFSAGPSTLPLSVLEKAQKEFLDFAGTGMSVTEISHRDKAFDAVVKDAETLVRELLNVPDDYAVIFVQGGASTQFAAVPLNMMHNGKADYIVTGNFAKKAWQEGQIYGEAVKIGDSSDKTYTYIPDVGKLSYSEDADYVHITSNNTIFGTRYAKFPECKAPLVADMSSEIFSREIDVKKFGVIYAGAQKNLAPAGVTIVIAKRDLIQDPLKICPTMLKWKIQDENGSLYNTPPCFSIYMADLVLQDLKAKGGVKAMNELDEYKAGLLYDFIDNSSLFKNNVVKEFRSIMNVPFVTPSAELDAKFIAEAKKAGLVSLKGHRLVGGMRASIYNAMPVEGVKALIEFMKKFELENK
ncbi:MAG TPA: 3-phosphoserine/phosphohydroxythreonine transaminase [Candidatus Coproplasma stercoravium]|nr:3-phosphoserine/phosphohydroxythreonine transaminase [Candidatus Coproplasma stercoravium]